jgi:hypothetical protein
VLGWLFLYPAIVLSSSSQRDYWVWPKGKPRLEVVDLS